MNNSMNPYGGVSPLIDKMIGNAYDIVKYVARYLKEIRYVAENMQYVYDAANGNRTRVTGLADGIATTVEMPMPADIVYDDIEYIQVLAYYDADTITFPGPDTFEFAISGGSILVQLHSVLPQVNEATYRVTITTRPAS